MNKIQNPEKVYRTAASQHGDRLKVSPDLLESMRVEYLDEIDRIQFFWRFGDGKAFAVSVEWERLADCMLRLGDEIEAVKAYCEAAYSCLEGVYYDYGNKHYPCFALRKRFCEMYRKAIGACSLDCRLWSFLVADSPLAETYRDFNRFDRLR